MVNIIIFSGRSACLQLIQSTWTQNFLQEMLQPNYFWHLQLPKPKIKINSIEVAKKQPIIEVLTKITIAQN